MIDFYNLLDRDWFEELNGEESPKDLPSDEDGEISFYTGDISPLEMEFFQANKFHPKYHFLKCTFYANYGSYINKDTILWFKSLPEYFDKITNTINEEKRRIKKTNEM